MISLEPESDAKGSGTAFRATSGRPWLRVVANWPSLAGRWIRLEYSQGLYDDPVRPLLRFDLPNGGQKEVLLPAPVLGRGIWVGRVPSKAMRALVSPAMRETRINFRVDKISPISRTSLLLQALTRNPKHLAYATALTILGRMDRARHRLSRAAVERPVSNYAAWRSERMRDLDPALDQPHFPGSGLNTFVLHASANGAKPEDVADTFASLQGQSHPAWRLEVESTEFAPEAVNNALRRLAERDKRLRLDREAQPETQATIHAELEFGDQLQPYALALVNDQFNSDSSLQAAYGDGEIGAGKFARPLLRSNWSRITGTSGQEVGLQFRRYRAGTHGPVVHIRRILVSHRTPRTLPFRALPDPIDWPSVTVIVPTRDRPDLLRACIDGILERTDYERFDLIVVDNDSEESATLSYLNELERHERGRVRRHPGAFNFSAICNSAATEAAGEILLFLNNDIIVERPNWLRALVSFARRDDVGAVGAMLHYPNGLIQHAGIALGPGHSAGHVYAGRPSDEPGVGNELKAPRELAAVTGACLAVSRAKFEAVGGFDAENFAVTLNDIDLCLRLNERGWRTIFTPEAVLQHHESASRSRNRTYHKELAAFRARWPDAIRDDPYFHPAYSLSALYPTLG